MVLTYAEGGSSQGGVETDSQHRERELLYQVHLSQRRQHDQVFFSSLLESFERLGDRKDKIK